MYPTLGKDGYPADNTAYYHENGELIVKPLNPLLFPIAGETVGKMRDINGKLYHPYFGFTFENEKLEHLNHIKGLDQFEPFNRVPKVDL